LPRARTRPVSNRKGERGGSTEVEIPLVERLPIRRRKVIPLVAGAVQIRSQTEHGFAIAPARRTERVASCHEKRVTNSTDPARRPDAAAPGAREPAYYLVCLRNRDPDHPAVVVAAVPEMTAERHIEHSVDDGQGSALILVAGIEGPPRSASATSIGHPGTVVPSLSDRAKMR
jgi:hypothetical protein